LILMTTNSIPPLTEQLDTSILIRSSPDRVYDAFATAAGLDAWFTQGAEVDARPGGHIVLRWKDWGPDHYAGEDGGPVLESQRPTLFAFQWFPDGPDTPITVRIAIRDAGEYTVVRLTETGYVDRPSGRRRQLDCAAGWGEALALCKFYVENGVRY
jgi:uncharacterized protein YndB with AHSA1/START domain